MNKLAVQIILGVLFIFVIAIIGYFLMSPKISSVMESTNIEYINSMFGFSITLPISWKGYTVSTDKWTGYTAGDQLGNVPFTDGPVVSIHNPKWTEAKPYQDIPIMVFTLSQWGSLQQEKFHIGAAPIGPSLLGRNSKYVFALPARYNYSFPPGYEEVEQILQSKPLKTF